MSLPAPLVSHNQLLTGYSLQQTLRGQQSQPYACQQLWQMRTPTLQVVSNPPHHRVKHNLPWVELPANINLWLPTLYQEHSVVWLVFGWKITSKHKSVRSEKTRHRHRRVPASDDTHLFIFYLQLVTQNQLQQLVFGQTVEILRLSHLKAQILMLYATYTLSHTNTHFIQKRKVSFFE